MPYYKEINTLFIHIPKTGGTSLEEYLNRNSSQTLFSLNTINNILFEKYNINTVSLQHLTYKEIYEYKGMLNVDFNEHLKIITIVRDPYDRIISDLFYFHLINENNSSNDVYEIIKKYICARNYDNHNIPQYKFLLDNNNSLIPNVTIFKTENLSQQLKDYGFQDFDVNSQINPQNIKKEKYATYLNNNSIKLINKFYKKDFELFNYDMKKCV
jgi:hypothetical protein